MPRHIVLVGLPGSGKSTAGRLVAEALAAPLIDIDGLLVREMGMPVSQIFGMVGEARFREMERDAVNAALAAEPGVIVPGGGWAAQPGQLERRDGPLPRRSISDACPVRRPSVASEGEARPLLAGVDPPSGCGRCWKSGTRSIPGPINGADRAQRGRGGCRRDHGPGPQRGGW